MNTLTSAALATITIYRHMNFRILLGGSIVFALFVCAAFAPILAPWDPGQMDLVNTLAPPAWMANGDASHLLGTDSLGRDTLSRLIWGARVAMYVAVVAGVSTMIIGSVVGLVAAYCGRWVDWVIVRLIDIWMCFPPVVLSLILMIALGVGINNVILAVVLVDWTRFARVIRAEALVTVRQDYVAAATLLGMRPITIIWREMLPAVLPLVITLLSLEMAIAVIVEALLSFVGVGVEASIPAWGQMIADGRIYVYQNVWGILAPVFAIFLAVFGFNLLGDGLRRALNPRSQQDAQ